jgi:hypothetical protein
MTLIINAATPWFIAHASDRLLTKRIGGKPRVHSDVENKTLIVRLDDAVCVIGYTGAAYVGEVITDQWIAETVTALDLGADFMMRQPGIRGLRLNMMLRRLEAGMKALRLPGSANYLGITVCGIRQRRSYAMPFIREFERNRGVVRSDGYMRNLRTPNFHLLSQMGDHTDMAGLQRTIGQEFAQHGISAEAFRQGMIKAIRDRAAVSKVVGDEIVTVTITRPQAGWDVVWTFETPRPRFAAVTNGSGNAPRVFRSYSSPWIISPAGIVKPAFGNGHLEHVSGDVRIRCGNEHRQDDEPGLFLAVSSQDRAPPR